LSVAVLSVIVQVVIPFRVSFQPGVALYEQVVYAAKKAVISGQMRPGEPFHTVDLVELQELKIFQHNIEDHEELIRRIFSLLTGAQS